MNSTPDVTSGMSAVDPDQLLMVGCDILSKEVSALVRKNHWPMACRFIDSGLHHYLDQLYGKLDRALMQLEGKTTTPIVFYGVCHPRMDELLNRHRAVRTPGQNCIAMLLGHEKFMEELNRGAYFILEEWALKWETMIAAYFGTNRQVVREIFHSSHKKIVAIRTPCSGDFTAAAQHASALVDLPLEWLNINLDELERTLAGVIEASKRTLKGKT